MSNFHAMWSLGGILGAGVAALVGWLAIPLTVSLPLVALAAALVARAASPRFLEVQEREVELSAAGVSIPWRPILVFGLVILLFYAVDTGTQTWSSVFMEETVDAGRAVVPLGYAGYTGGALISRLLGDRFVGWWGAVRVVVVGSVVAMVGFSVVTAAPSPPVAIVGFVLGGLGLGVLAPLAFAALAGAVPAVAMDAAIARMNVANYAGAIVGGGVIGVVADLGNLRLAFVVPLICAGAVLLVAPAFRAADTLAAPVEE